jgi:hypothetical protein
MNRGTLKKHIVLVLGEKGRRSTLDLGRQIKSQYYWTESLDIFNAGFNCVLRQLVSDGIIEESTDLVALAKKGFPAYKSYVSKYEAKRPRKNGRDNQGEGLTPTDQHEEGKQYLKELACTLGKAFKNEHPLARSVRIDHVWFLHPLSSEITHAFEVQNKGDWKNAIGDLEAARRYHENCRLFVVVVDQKQIPTIRSLLNSQKNNHVKIVRLAQIRDWVETLKKLDSIERELILNTAKDLIHSNIID